MHIRNNPQPPLYKQLRTITATLVFNGENPGVQRFAESDWPEAPELLSHPSTAIFRFGDRNTATGAAQARIKKRAMSG